MAVVNGQTNKAEWLESERTWGEWILPVDLLSSLLCYCWPSSVVGRKSRLGSCNYLWLC